MRKALNNIRTLALILTTSVVMAACGEKREVPELIAPATETESYRPVGREDVGEMKVAIGNVTPQPYCHYYERATTIKEICCDIGQYVEQGEVLVVADIDSKKEELTELRANLDLLVAQHEVNAPIYELNQKILASNRQECLYRYDEEGASNYTTEIKKGEEDHVYDEQLYQYMVDYYNNEIADIEEDISKVTITAKKSGYVTYIKDTSKNSNAAANEAIVIISDYDDKFIEVPSITTDRNEYKRYEVKYALVQGKKIPIQEIEYTTHEQVYARAVGSYPDVRYELTEPVELEVGDTVILCFVRNDRRNVIAIGYDSSNADENGNYVYVKEEDGSTQKRYIELGATDDCYYEVLSGLEEGEEVLYTQESVVPVNYEEYTVETGTQITTALANGLKKAETVNTAYFAPCKGKVESLLTDTGSMVKKGDVLMVIDSGSGEAAIQEIENDIKHLKMDYDKYLEEADKNIKTMTVQGLRLLTVIEEGKDHGTLGEHEEDAIECQRTVYGHKVKIAEIEKEAKRLEYESELARLNRKITKLKKNNDGSGKISVIAKEDSVVSKLYVKEGDLIEPGKSNDLLLSCTKETNGVGCIVAKDSLPPLNCKVTISINNSEDKYFGKGISCVKDGKAYAFTEEDKAHVCTTVGTGKTGSNYVFFELEDREFFDKVQLKDCETKIQMLYAEEQVILPGSMVYNEENPLTGKERTFVWKIIDGKPIKQYVVKGTTFSLGTDSSVVILRGVEPGDILAKEKGAVTTEKEEK